MCRNEAFPKKKKTLRPTNGIICREMSAQANYVQSGSVDPVSD